MSEPNEPLPLEELFLLPDGTTVRTGNLLSSEKPHDLNVFADKIGILTRDEIAKILHDRNRVAGRKRFEARKWIKNQGRRGSCNAYAVASIVEKARYVRGEEHIVLGPEYLYSLVNGGRDSGSQLKHGIAEAMRTGIPPKEFVKYESYRKSEQSAEAAANAGRFRILDDEIFGIHSDEELATALALGFFVLVAVHVTNAWMKLDGNGVVSPTSGPGNHAIHVDDLRINSRGEYEFDHAGSWGLNYGQEGRGWITWNRHMKSTVRYHEFAAVRSTTDDPSAKDQFPKRSL